jgi:predicted nucleic acid-binding protein
MYLIDTNVISELRKKSKADKGVKAFFSKVVKEEIPVYISVITIGELRRGVELIRHRGDLKQSAVLESWLDSIIADYEDFILDFSETEAQLWGKLRAPNPQHTLDKQIAATALSYNLCVVTRNVDDFKSSGVSLINPFDESR